MWTISLKTFIFLCFVCGSRSYPYSYTNPIFEDMNWTSTAEAYAQHIQNQLDKPESRFISRPCLRSLREYYGNLLRFKPWALLMFDANAKLPSGLFRGYGAGLGAFDQCLNIQHESKKVGTIRGKYCLGNLRLLNLNKEKTDIARVSNSSGSSQSRQIDLHAGTVSIPWGVCLPDACSAKDFRFLRLFILRFSEESCQTKESQSKQFDGGDIAAISVLGVIASLMVFSTVYDLIVYYTGKDRGYILLRSFSAFTNGSKIVTIKNDDNDISCIYGLRVLSMFAIMYGFRYALYIFHPLVNWLDMLKWITNKNKSSLLEALICGDTFFVLSGLLISYNYLKAKEAGVRFNLFVYYLHRIIRLTPALAITVLIHATLMRHLGSGPVWPNIRDQWLVNNCREYWWSSLLYVQNYVNPNPTKICIMQTWHLSVDMQLFLLSPLVLIPLSRAPKYTVSFLSFLLFCAILSPFLSAWVYKLKAILVTNQSLDDIYDYMEHYYFPMHTRAASWIIGFLMGYFIYETKKPSMRIIVKQKLNKIVVLFLWALSLSAILFCIFIGREMVGLVYDWVTHAFHMALIRPVWSAAIAWIVFACAHGYGGPINSFLSASIFQVLSRITYCTYLINQSLMFILTSQTRMGLEFSDGDVFYRFSADILPVLALGLVWTLAFESPMITIENVIFGRSKDSKIESSHKKVEEII